jgi:photosystem II stability/assembly factor-like uncharacterized protein
LTQSRWVIAVAVCSCICFTEWAAAGTPWQPIGPFGGDARSLVADPHNFSRLFVGTSNSQIYSSTDGGQHWSRLSAVAPREDLVVGRLLIHPTKSNLLYAGAYTTGNGEGGGVFRSTDGGVTWKELPGIAGQSVRALIMAPGEPQRLFAGTLEGVFRSYDGGATWDRISPKDNVEIHNVESLAVDPRDPSIVYAGTWHLPWKTTDGGAHWFSIKEGILDDSDVFTITVDWFANNIAYLGACSGIYRTENAGKVWRKVHGIPFSARRTRAIRQDPEHPSVVYAGTTEGLWKTADGGEAWTQMTSPTLIVNEVAIDPGHPEHIVLATDRAGVLESRDGAKTFQPINNGFSHRQIWRLESWIAPGGKKVLAAASRYDKEYGGVFLSEDGQNWHALPEGLNGADVISLIVGPDGTLLAGGTDGLYRFLTDKGIWQQYGRLLTLVTLPSGRQGYRGEPASFPIADFAVSGRALFAATPEGVLWSTDGGLTWQNTSPAWNAERMASSGKMLVVATATDGIQISLNSGGKWIASSLPESPIQVQRLALDGRSIYAATDHGLFRSTDASSDPSRIRWELLGHGVPTGAVYDVLIDPNDGNVIYAGSSVNDRVYVSHDGGENFEAMSDQPGYIGRPRRLALGPGGRLYMASDHDGLFSRVP